MGGEGRAGKGHLGGEGGREGGGGKEEERRGTQRNQVIRTRNRIKNPFATLNPKNATCVSAC